jgi:uncharacterized ferritin-like protein (DUF455 family)
MEIREWALTILNSGNLEEKLFFPEHLTDDAPGSPHVIAEPVRSVALQMNRRKKEQKLPRLDDLKTAEKRAVCLHRFAGHELLAVEIMAYALLLFPDAPKSFRKGVVHTLHEEQVHVRLYCKRLEELGGKFGSLPLYRHFWTHTPFLKTPLHYLSVMPLTLEMANLDFAPIYGKAFLKAEDEVSSQLMARILTDEISHVRFGVQWLKRLGPKEMEPSEIWENNLKETLLTPKRAKGFYLHPEPRRKAGVDDAWIEKLKLFR